MVQKEYKKRDKCRCLVNFKPSLTQRRKELLYKGNNKIKDNYLVQFLDTAMYRTLKILLQNPLKHKFVYSFNVAIELNILSKLDPHYQESRQCDKEMQKYLIFFFFFFRSDHREVFYKRRCSAKSVLQRICSATVVSGPGKCLQVHFNEVTGLLTGMSSFAGILQGFWSREQNACFVEHLLLADSFLKIFLENFSIF